MKKNTRLVILIVLLCTLVTAWYILPRAPKQEQEKDAFLKVEDYIMSLRNEDGGFGPDPRTGNSTIESTAYAVLAMKELGRLKAFNKTVLEGIYNFTLSQQRWDGGFGNDITWEYSTLYHTYLAVKCLDTFNRTFILNNQYLGSYFAGQFYDDGSAGSIINTFYAVDGMIMANLSEPVRNTLTANTSWFILSLYTLPGGFGETMFDDKPYVYSTYFALQTMFDLGFYETELAQEMINNSTEWVSDCFDEETGGFGNRQGRKAVIDVTYWATKCLNDTKQHLGATSSYDKSDAEQFIMACQKEDGGFVKSPESTEESSIVWTYYALAALNQVCPISDIKAVQLEVTQIRAVAFLIIAIGLILGLAQPWKPLKHGEVRKHRKVRERMEQERAERKSRTSTHRSYYACERCGRVIRSGIVYKCQSCGKVVCEQHQQKCGCNFPNPKPFKKIRKTQKTYERRKENDDKK